MDQPLFGEARPRDKYLNLGLIIATIALYIETVVMAFIAGFLLDGKKCKRVYGHDYGPHFCVYAVDIIICLIILALLGTQAFMVYWYRQGELDPKFRKLLIYNGVVLILLCLCANLYFLQVGYTGVPTKK